MPISYVIDEKRCQVRTTVTGPVTVQDIFDHVELSCRREILGYAELIDARAAGQPFLSPADLWRTARAIRALNLTKPFGPRAILVADDRVYALSCLFAVGVMGLISISVFRNLHSAENWLDWRAETRTAATAA